MADNQETIKQPLRGMKDLSPETKAQFRQIENIFRSSAERFCYQEVSTPLLEPLLLFSKTFMPDVLNKELYQFQDKSEREVALRPEGTAGIVRFFLNENPVHKRFFYSGPMFRYERPQKGRLRQFHQMGIEFFGQFNPQAELEVIQLACIFLNELGILKGLKLLINSIGDEESRKAYRSQLVSYLKPREKELSPESQDRLQRNPLRILDSSSKVDQKILEKAPLPKDFLNKESLVFYDKILSFLAKHNIDFQEEGRLVRGLDYYSHTVFEFVSPDLGSQSTVLAGGRYDSLLEEMGGPPTPAIGWAAGLERLSLLHQASQKQGFLIAVVFNGEALSSEADRLIYSLRSEGFCVLPKKESSFSKQMKYAAKQEVSYLVILAEKEWGNKTVILKNMKNSEQKLFSLQELFSQLKNIKQKFS